MSEQPLKQWEFSPNARLEASALKVLFNSGSFYREVDGDWVVEINGVWSAAGLQAVVKILNDANRLWHEQIRKDLRCGGLSSH